jgi:hypothetical protein
MFLNYILPGNITIYIYINRNKKGNSYRKMKRFRMRGTFYSIFPPSPPPIPLSGSFPGGSHLKLA